MGTQAADASPSQLQVTAQTASCLVADDPLGDDLLQLAKPARGPADAAIYQIPGISR
jgi:hypothetical protein